MKERKLGPLGVSGLGLGCMGMSWRYGPADESEALAVLRRYFELGGNFLDTAEIYGPYKNEELIARFLREVPRDRIILATKFGFRIDPDGQFAGVDSSPSNVRKACEGSLCRLGVDSVDLYYQHRVDPGLPIEETVGANGRIWWGRERCVRWDYRRQASPPCDVRTLCIQSRHFRANIRSGRAM